ncbi:integrating conjugative element protein [Carnimonas bestiolae]|uniref:integrating conjugative element protein n=1 Tax=Carnimonas bestiolae TaxID=3402172 RepID=UPI003F4ABCD9
MPQLTVVADHGGRPARPFFAAISGSGVNTPTQTEPKNQAGHPMPAASEADMLPVSSEHLTPGRVSPQRLQLPRGFQPFFIVGNDGLSVRWLEQRGEALREMHAVGLIVNVASTQELEALKHVGGNLEMHPVKGDDLAQRLRISHYPVLISAQGLEQ